MGSGESEERKREQSIATAFLAIWILLLAVELYLIFKIRIRESWFLQANVNRVVK